MAKSVAKKGAAKKVIPPNKGVTTGRKTPPKKPAVKAVAKKPAKPAPKKAGDDIFAAFNSGPPPEQLAAMRTKAEEAVSLDKQCAELEELLNSAKTALNLVLQKELPNMLLELGMKGYDMEDGSSIKLKEKVIGSLPKEEDKRQAAFDYLEEIEAADIIKSTVSLKFDKAKLEEAKELEEELKERGFEPSLLTDVHASTLHALVNERLKASEPVDMDKLGCSHLRFVQVVLPEAAKPPKPKAVTNKHKRTS